MDLDLVDGRLAICRMDPGAPVPAWASRGRVTMVVRTPDETTVVCAEEAAPARVRAERGFRAMAVRGPLDLASVGVIAALARPIAEAGVPIFVVSTFDADWLLVREDALERATAALAAAGHAVHRREVAPPARPASIDFVYAPAEDVDAMRRFYVEALGVPESAFRSGQWLSLRNGSLELVSMQEPAGASGGWASQPGWPGGEATVPSWSVQVPEERLAEVVARLRAAGVPAFFPAPTWAQGSYWSYPVRDPAGNTVEVYAIPAVLPADPVWRA